MFSHAFGQVREALEHIEPYRYFGRVTAVRGLAIEIEGLDERLPIGARLAIYPKNSADQASGRASCLAEVVGFNQNAAIAFGYQSVEGINLGAEAFLESLENRVSPSDAWLGRVIDGLAQPVDGQGTLTRGETSRPIKAPPPESLSTNRLGDPLDFGIRAINTFTTCRQGQRLGIFAGTGVGKSSLLSMLARNAEADVIVIGLIGERSREVREFVEDVLGPEGRKRAVVVVASSSETAVMRRQAAYLTMTVAEHFREHGKQVLCMMDSVTRFAIAQREIGLSAGEPPTTRGFTPSVFAEIPRLLERAGPGKPGEGFVTGLFTVLVEGDDTNEPITDLVRGTLDGHIFLDRAIAERGRFPAVNVLKSISRTMPQCVPEEWRPLLQEVRRYLSTYADMEELIRLGAYRKGSDPLVDRSIELYDGLEAFLAQDQSELVSFSEGYEQLAAILASPPSEPEENVP